MAAGDGTYVCTPNSEPAFAGKGQKHVDAVDQAAEVGGRDNTGSSAPRTFAVGNNITLMCVNLVLLVALNIAMIITIMCYSFKKPETELEHDIYDKPKVRAGVIAVSCSHVVLWAVQMLACIRHRSFEMRIQGENK
ncbi:MAG: hypothetical protein BJ554DRAFT_4188 [Olpidium bornovanus]|uniref:Uncharacterized protein n=1 Tax=Olpidium bornovanus TaxID=278681 RepID=A0A8H8A031_9FUNG|nr:MAG: hypothetical protein BJ554DRAFT_4188 [Olpidium bornovanus]